MPTADTLQWNRNTSFLFKSSPGLGKTIAACSAAIYGDILLLYIDKSRPTEVLSFYTKYRPELLKNINYECYGSNNIFKLQNLLVKLTKDGCPYRAVIVDGVTTFTRAAVNWSMGFRDPKGADKDEVNSASNQLIPGFDDYKVETGMVTQCLDMCKVLNTMVIWTAHPLPKMEIQGQQSAGGQTQIKAITTSSQIVSYGNKIGAMIPGDFSEIYHFGRQGNQRVVWTDMIGDDYARTSLPFAERSFDITDKLFFEVWEEEVKKGFIALGGGEMK